MSEPFYTDKSRVRQAFERAAPAYDAAAVLQREVSDRMAERLDNIRHQPERILDAGSGTGYGSAMLKTRYPDSRILELDLAHAMLVTARQKVGDGEQGWLGKLLGKRPPTWQVCGDIEALPIASEAVDMVWSSLAIQWVNTPDATLTEFHRILRVGGLLMFATLGPDTLIELNRAFAGIDSHTHTNRFIDMHDVGDALVRAGFATPVMDMEKIVMTYDDLRGVMHDLKGIGAHNVTAGRKPGLMGKTAWQRLEANYETLRRNGKLPATYEVVYGHAWKPEIRPSRKLDDGSQIIEFMRPTRTA